MFQFSYKAIADVVIARVALRHHLHPDTPSLLTTDHRAGINIFIEEAFTDMLLAMVPFVKDSGMDQASDALTLEIELPSGGSTAAALPVQVRTALEAAVAVRAMQLIADSVDADWSAKLSEEYAVLTDRVRSLCGESTPPLRRPCWY